MTYVTISMDLKQDVFISQRSTSAPTSAFHEGDFSATYVWLIDHWTQDNIEY